VKNPSWSQIAATQKIWIKEECAMLNNLKELKVWQKSYQLCLLIYKITSKFPGEERYSLTAQIRRVVVSIPSNIAEGHGRRTTADYIRSLYIACGSISELETQLMLSADLGYLDDAIIKDISTEINEIERMLKALIKSLENKQ
jgi:four helix bundle protein